MTLAPLRLSDNRLRTVRGPLVVLDRNLLTYGRPESVLPQSAEIVLPDAYFREMAEAHRERELDGFRRWIRQHYATVWIARFWFEVVTEEDGRQEPLDPTSIISTFWTERLRVCALQGDFDWPIEMEDELYDQARADFLCRCQNWTARVEAQLPGLRKDLEPEKDLCEFLQSPDPIVRYVETWHREVCDKPWANLIGRFPDRLALCRWCRIVNYYTIMHSLGETQSFENNWEDAQYAFAASYVGRIATNDRRLKQMMQRILPGIEIRTTEGAPS